MKIKSLLGLGTVCVAGLGLTITLPLVLSSCSNGIDDNEQNPIRFTGNQNPVNPHQTVTIIANVSNPNNYTFSWSYSYNGSDWIAIPYDHTNRLVIPAEKVTSELNKCQFKLTISNSETGKIYSSTTSVKVIDSTLSLSPIEIDNKIAVVNVSSVNMSVKATSNLANAEFNYQWQYKAKAPTIALNSLANDTSNIGWTNCKNGQQSNFNIPANQVSWELNNYEFRCLVTLNNALNSISKATDPVSIQVGYAVADSNIDLSITNKSTDIIQNQKLSLIANSITNQSLKYQWFYKSGSSGYTVSQVTDKNPITGWTEIIQANKSTLNIDPQYVTQQLVNTEFMVVGYENDKLTYNTVTFKVTEVKQVPITVNLTEPAGPIYEGQDITLTAIANGENVDSQPSFTYEWYYAPVNKTGEPSVWQKISDQSTESLVLKQVTQEYNNYQFKCKAIDVFTSNSGESTPISINVQEPTPNSQISISFNEQPEIIYPSTEDVTITATASCSGIDNFTYKWWFKKTANKNTSTSLALNPEAEGWTAISSCESDTLTIPSNQVTMDLNNYKFLCQATAKNQSWNFNYATTKITVTPAPEVNPEANSNIKIQVTGNENVITGQNLTLSACATCTTPEPISDFSYQWYYKPISPISSTYFFKSLMTQEESVNNDPIQGWTMVDKNGNKENLVIPQNFITPDLTNYQFMCVAYQTSNNKNFNTSNPVTISSITQTNIPCNVGVITNLVNNLTNKWTENDLRENCSVPSQPNEAAVVNPTLIAQIAKELGILPSNIDKIYITPGNEYWPTGKFMANIQIVLKSGCYFETVNTSGSVPGNNKTGINASGNTLTITNISTNIENKVISNGDSTKPEFEKFKQMLQEADLKDVPKYLNKLLTYSETTKPLFDAVAKVYGINPTFISNIKINYGGSSSRPNKSSLSFSVWFKSGVCLASTGWSAGNESTNYDSVWNGSKMNSVITVMNLSNLTNI